MERLLEQHPLRHGAHPTRGDGMCAMEMVAWLAGEPHSDEPRCACPVIAAFVRALNDSLPSDAARNRLLRPLVPKLVNTRANARVEALRGRLAADAGVRELLPVLLERQGRLEEAALLRQLPPLHDDESIEAATRALEHYARDQHAMRWVLQRANDGTPPARYVAGVLQVIRRLGDSRAWQLAVDLSARLVAVAPQATSAADGVR